MAEAVQSDESTTNVAHQAEPQLADEQDYDIERRKEFLCLQQEDAERIEELAQFAEEHTGEIVDRLYEHFLAFDETGSFLSDEEVLKRLRRTQSAYFLKLFDGEYGEEYMQDRLRIGRTHERIGLEPKWYLGAYARYINLLVPRLAERFDDDSEAFADNLSSLLKVFFLDMGFAIDTYVEARRRREQELTQQFTSSLGSYAAKLESSTNEIAAAISQQSASARQQAAAVSEVTSTAEELQQTSAQAQDHAQEVIENSEGSVAVARRGNEAVEDSVEAMKQIRRQVESIAEKILNLSEQTQQVGEIIESVSEIAEQSKLLALNASIEASRAGEHGRGFSVVADEMRTLADQSKEATRQVRSILGEIQKATNSAVIATEEGSKKVESGVDLAEEAGETIHTLSQVTEEAADAAQLIDASSNQQSRGIQQVSEAMGQIDEAMHDFTEGLSQTEDATDQLQEMIDEMTRLVDEFTS